MKEAWQMTRQEYVVLWIERYRTLRPAHARQYQIGPDGDPVLPAHRWHAHREHWEVIRNAVHEGKQIPADVFESYHDPGSYRDPGSVRSAARQDPISTVPPPPAAPLPLPNPTPERSDPWFIACGACGALVQTAALATDGDDADRQWAERVARGESGGWERLFGRWFCPACCGTSSRVA
jgi:hypothetical protein